MAKNRETAAKKLGIDYEIEKVTDIESISAAGVFLTPVLAVDGEMKVVGKGASRQEIRSDTRLTDSPMTVDRQELISDTLPFETRDCQGAQWS